MFLMSKLFRINLFLNLLLGVSLLFLFLQNVSLSKKQSFSEKRIDILESTPYEKRSASVQIPQAGESGTLSIKEVSDLVDQKIKESISGTINIQTATASPKQTTAPISKKFQIYQFLEAGLQQPKHRG